MAVWLGPCALATVMAFPWKLMFSNAVWDRVRQSKDVVLKYYSSGAEQMSLLANEEVWLGDVWSGRVAVLQRQGHPLKTVVPPGARTYVGTMYVLKGSPMDAAHQLLNAMLEPEAAIAVSKAMAYPTVLDPTKFKLPDEIRWGALHREGTLRLVPKLRGPSLHPAEGSRGQGGHVQEAGDASPDPGASAGAARGR
jgi:spermidine/putrescine transport system substrate-binding protein